jgi:hypothetical protein
MDVREFNERFSDNAVPGLDDPTLDARKKFHIRRLLRHARAFAGVVVTQTGGLGDESLSQVEAVDSLQQCVLHACEAILLGHYPPHADINKEP